jgi:hypothetical protein
MADVYMALVYMALILREVVLVLMEGVLMVLLMVVEENSLMDEKMDFHLHLYNLQLIMADNTLV